ncbi:src kinase-associated phosphoprotein 1 [Triplophysa rosa]|uniref:Src kinase-associated phosphoprotein 1 n=1 Tax=Triplophysa rosa TaxID=992332 RepID=A0A9W7THQ0_TRIRA|nr:src kinase-associated phosphoprotein 1 [Triplophysa rosa]XP_057214693.1 src kinase-associated phosphoprotein 1 [Triplophysa rosa]KAI7796628.1 putative src kinase-associated phosphoprotein 1 [Triplophysa rosa]
MGTVVDDFRQLLKDCELFVFDILQDEELSTAAHEAREILLRNFYVIQKRHPQEFPHRFETSQEDSSDDNRSNSLGRSAPSDDVSVASDYQEEGAPEFFEEIPLVAAQDLTNILKQGYLEKKRRDHSFFSIEWQKRWCVLNNTIFYYFGNEKDKQQKGSFNINGYSAEPVPSLRKDSRKNSCFELSAPGSRSFQFTASSPREAREWVDQINFVLKDLSSNFIPVDDDEEEEVEEVEETYDDIERATTPPPSRPGPAPASVPTPSKRQPPQSSREEWEDRGRIQEDDDEEEEDIYEVLPDDENLDQVDEGCDKIGGSDYANYYQGLWDCEAEGPDDLAFQRGDLIYILSKEYNIYGWWVGELDGAIGIVPKEFLHPAYIL